MMVDATSAGVKAYYWSGLRENIGKDGHYEKVVFKKVNFARTPKKVKSLDDFLQKHMGDEYCISPQKLMRKNTIKEE